MILYLLKAKKNLEIISVSFVVCDRNSVYGPMGSLLQDGFLKRYNLWSNGNNKVSLLQIYMIIKLLSGPLTKSLISNPATWLHFIKSLPLSDTGATNLSLLNDLIFSGRVNSDQVYHPFRHYWGINYTRLMEPGSFLALCMQVTLSLIPSDNRLSTT